MFYDPDEDQVDFFYNLLLHNTIKLKNVLFTVAIYTVFPRFKMMQASCVLMVVQTISDWLSRLLSRAHYFKPVNLPNCFLCPKIVEKGQLELSQLFTVIIKLQNISHEILF